MLFRFDLRVAALVMVFCCLGCAKQDGDLPEVQPVSGSVTYNGKPVDNGSVTFHSESARKPATGLLDKQGRFELTTFARHDGAEVGKYRVTVLAFDQSGSGDDEGLAAYSIPLKYTQEKTTPLEAEVKEGDNTIDLELED